MWPIPSASSAAVAANFGERPLGDIVAELTAVRAAFIAYAMAGHERHHLADIRRQHGG
jgi:hypothetical protein